MKLIAYVLGLAHFLVEVAANESTTFGAIDINSNHNMAFYYGQNSAGGVNTQQRLAYYCNSSAASLFVVGFLNVFPDPIEINLGPSCPNDIINGTKLLRCTAMEEDIKFCQQKGKKVLLSLGGESGGYGFTNDSQAVEFGDKVWNLFGNSTMFSRRQRPFGDAVMDGFDLDIEGGQQTGYPSLVNRLREHFDQDKSRDYYIGVAPQCPIPDQYLSETIEKSQIDLVFVQFYNNYCGIGHYNAQGTSQFNYKDWDQYIHNKSKNKNAMIFLGIPGSPSAANEGYVDSKTVIEVSSELQSSYCSFGGVMIWDVSQAWNNHEGDGNSSTFGEKIYNGIKGNANKNCNGS